MDHLASGPPQNWWADLPSSPLLASLSPAITTTTSILLSPAFLLPLLLTYIFFILWLIFYFYRYDTATRFVHRNMAVDPQADFVGDVEVNNDPPTKATLEKIANLPVLDANNKSHTFKSLYADDEKGPRRVFICFIRHFFCGVRPPQIKQSEPSHSPNQKIEPTH